MPTTGAKQYGEALSKSVYVHAVAPACLIRLNGSNKVRARIAAPLVSRRLLDQVRERIRDWHYGPQTVKAGHDGVQLLCRARPSQPNKTTGPWAASPTPPAVPSAAAARRPARAVARGSDARFRR